MVSAVVTAKVFAVRMTKPSSTAAMNQATASVKRLPTTAKSHFWIDDLLACFCVCRWTVIDPIVPMLAMLPSTSLHLRNPAKIKHDKRVSHDHALLPTSVRVNAEQSPMLVRCIVLALYGLMNHRRVGDLSYARALPRCRHEADLTTRDRISLNCRAVWRGWCRP